MKLVAVKLVEMATSWVRRKRMSTEASEYARYQGPSIPDAAISLTSMAQHQGGLVGLGLGMYLGTVPLHAVYHVSGHRGDLLSWTMPIAMAPSLRGGGLAVDSRRERSGPSQ